METKKIYLHALHNMEHFQFAGQDGDTSTAGKD